MRVARRLDLTHAEVAADFDISVESVRRWVRQADIDDGVVEGRTSSEQDEVVTLRWVTDIAEPPHRRGKALLLRGQGPVQQPDRRLRPRQTNDRRADRDRAAHCDVSGHG
ncbi:hypothetical protein [Pseudonocardia sp. ICBG1142]|uniref:hypothetical protein n=1 Tax=Pseudonocardia sp. ICBG1142 TaxID=2846760 RepID=UPI0035A87C31